MKTSNNSGVILVVVVCFTAIAAILAMGLLTESGFQLKAANRQVCLEQAFYVAEGGAERAVSYIRNGGAIPSTITGMIGNGTYSTVILPTLDPTASATGSTHAMSGSLNINPNNSPDNEFLLLKPDGTVITRDDLQNDSTVYTNSPCVYYTGPALLIHVKPHGNGNQNTLVVDGNPFTLENANTYDFFSSSMNVQIANDHLNPGNGHANGQWWVDNIVASDVTLNDSGSGLPSDYFSVYSIGTVNTVRRIVILDGVHQQTWAKYALWYSTSAGSIWIVSGEHFYGPVHANYTLYLDGNPIFEELVTTTASGWGAGSDWDQVAFMQGYQFNAPTQSMASVSFLSLRNNATLVVTGLTSITLSGTNLLITNSRQGWSNVNYAVSNADILTTGLIYVASSGTNIGTASVGGTLDGRLTIATDYNIHITNHITYAVHPTNNSDDALGLIARNDVVVRTNAPNNLHIFAHIMAACTTNSFSHGFYVQNYSSRPSSSNLNVYGGIVEYTRGAVGTTAGNGYRKNYRYDIRFATDPPPQYPVLTHEYLWTGWREKTL